MERHTAKGTERCCLPRFHKSLNVTTADVITHQQRAATSLKIQVKKLQDVSSELQLAS